MKRLLLDHAGATAVEYALLTALIAVGLYLALYSTSQGEAETFGTISSTLNSATGPARPAPADPADPGADGPSPPGASPAGPGPMGPMGPMGPTEPMGPMGPMEPASPSGPRSVPGGGGLPAGQPAPMTAGGNDPSTSSARAPGAPNQDASTPQT